MYVLYIFCLPMLAMMTAGSFDGTCCNNGKISSITSHLSRCGSNLPKQISPLTLTDSKVVCIMSLFILGKSAVLMAWKSSKPKMQKDLNLSALNSTKSAVLKSTMHYSTICEMPLLYSCLKLLSSHGESVWAKEFPCHRDGKLFCSRYQFVDYFPLCKKK